MTIPLYKWPNAIDWTDIVSTIFEKHNIDITDFLGHFSREGRLRLKELTDLHGIHEGHKLFDLERPYLNYWNWILEGPVRRDGINRLNLNPEEMYSDETPEWIKEIGELIREEVKDSPAYDSEDQVLTFYVDW